MCWVLCLFWARHTICNKLSSFPTWNFVIFVCKWAFVAQWKFTTKAAIFRCVQTRYTRIFIIFILKTTLIGSQVKKTEITADSYIWGWFIHQHDLTLIIIDYAFGSAHVKIGVWPKVGLQAFFTVGQAWRTPQPLQIKSVELNWIKCWTSHEPKWLTWVQLMWSTAFDPGLRRVLH